MLSLDTGTFLPTHSIATHFDVYPHSPQDIISSFTNISVQALDRGLAMQTGQPPTQATTSLLSSSQPSQSVPTSASQHRAVAAAAAAIMDFYVKKSKQMTVWCGHITVITPFYHQKEPTKAGQTSSNGIIATIAIRFAEAFRSRYRHIIQAIPHHTTQHTYNTTHHTTQHTTTQHNITSHHIS